MTILQLMAEGLMGLTIGLSFVTIYILYKSTGGDDE